MSNLVRVLNFKDGLQRVAFTSIGRVREVGSIFQQATMQYCRPSDWIAQSDGKFFIISCKGDVVETPIPKPLPEWVKTWFKTGEHRLPTGRGWDGENTVASLRRAVKIKSVLFGLHHEILANIQDFGRVTPSSKMVLTWKLAERLPMEYIGGIANSAKRPPGTNNLSWGYIHWGTGRAKWAGAFESIPLKNQGIFYAACTKMEGHGRVDKELELKLYKGVIQ